MNRLVVAPSARSDLDQIWDDIAIENDAPTAAVTLLDRFQDAFSRLSTNSGLGTTCEWLRPGVRRFPVWPYIIFYSPITGESKSCASFTAPGILRPCSVSMSVENGSAVCSESNGGSKPMHVPASSQGKLTLIHQIPSPS